MIQAVEFCPNHPKQPLKRVSLEVIHNKNHRTIVGLMMCDKCRQIKIKKKELDNWFGG